MGTSHAISAVPAWLAGCLVAAPFGVHQSPVQVGAGLVLCVGGSLIADLDMSGAFIAGKGGATIARTFGRTGLAAAEVVDRTSLWVYRRTATRYDDPRNSGHRTLTHTLVFNLAVGAGAWGLAAGVGRWGVFAMLLALSLASLRALAPWKVRRRKGWRPASVAFAVAGSLAMAFALPAGGAGFVGLAVGAGALVHLAGDWITVAGVPLYWPIKVRGKRWWMSRLYPIKAGDRTETKLAWVCGALAGGIFACLVDPHLVAAFGLWLANGSGR